MPSGPLSRRPPGGCYIALDALPISWGLRVAVAREAVVRFGEAAGRRVVAARVEAYRADDPETTGVDTAAEAVGGVRPASRPGVRRSPNAHPMKEWERGGIDLAGGRRDWLHC